MQNLKQMAMDLARNQSAMRMLLEEALLLVDVAVEEALVPGVAVEVDLAIMAVQGVVVDILEAEVLLNITIITTIMSRSPR